MRTIFRAITLAVCLVAALTLLATTPLGQSGTGTGSSGTTQTTKQTTRQTTKQTGSKIRGPVISVMHDRTGQRRTAPSEQIQTQSAEAAPPGEQSSAPTASGPTASAPTASAPAQYCGGGKLLLADTIGGIRIFLYGFPPNQTYIEESRQSVPGTLTFSLTFDGSYVETIHIPVPVGADGTGVSDVFFVQGMQVGQSTASFCDDTYGCTTTIDYEVLPQCNCPPIPVIQ